MSHTGILESMVTTQWKPRKSISKTCIRYKRSHAYISNQSLSPRRNQDALQSSSTAQKNYIIYIHKGNVQQKVASMVNTFLL